MDCFYINLDSALERRNKIQSNFDMYSTQGWSLTRFPAINVAQAENYQGSLWDRGKACYLSHKMLIEKHLEHKPILVLEDDAQFGKSTCSVIEKFLNNQQSLDWDIVFTDLAVTNPFDALKLIHKRTRSTETVSLLPLQDLSFCGATAYLVNPKSKSILLDLLDGDITVPFDLKLKDAILNKKLKGFTFFPFLTTLSDEAEKSQIGGVREEKFPHQDPEVNLVLAWNLFRKMIWADREHDNFKDQLSDLTSFVDDETLEYMPVVAAMISKSFLLR